MHIMKNGMRMTYKVLDQFEILIVFLNFSSHSLLFTTLPKNFISILLDSPYLIN